MSTLRPEKNSVQNYFWSIWIHQVRKWLVITVKKCCSCRALNGSKKNYSVQITHLISAPFQSWHSRKIKALKPFRCLSFSSVRKLLPKQRRVWGNTYYQSSKSINLLYQSWENCSFILPFVGVPNDFSEAVWWARQFLACGIPLPAGPSLLKSSEPLLISLRC